VIRGVEFIEGIIFLSISITYFGLETLEDVTWDFARWLMLTQRRWHLANFFIWIVISRPPKGRTQFILYFSRCKSSFLLQAIHCYVVLLCSFVLFLPGELHAQWDFTVRIWRGWTWFLYLKVFLSQKIRQKPVMFCIMYVYILTGSTIDLQIRVLEIHFNWFNQFNHLKCNEETILSNDFVGIKGQFHN
jgi:hypothetical protein